MRVTSKLLHAGSFMASALARHRYVLLRAQSSTEVKYGYEDDLVLQISNHLESFKYIGMKNAAFICTNHLSIVTK